MLSLYSDSGGDRIFLNFFGVIFFLSFYGFLRKGIVFFFLNKICCSMVDACVGFSAIE